MGRVTIDSDLYLSEAYRSLSKWALVVLGIFWTRRRMEEKKTKSKTPEWFIANNGKITFCYSEAKKYGIKEREFRNAIDELIEKGFLDLTHQGTGGLSHDKSTYFLDNRWQNWGTSDFIPAKKPRKKNHRNSNNFKAINALRAKEKQLLLSNLSDHKPHSPDIIDRSWTENEMFRLADLSDHKIPFN